MSQFSFGVHCSSDLNMRSSQTKPKITSMWLIHTTSRSPSMPQGDRNTTCSSKAAQIFQVIARASIQHPTELTKLSFLKKQHLQSETSIKSNSNMDIMSSNIMNITAQRHLSAQHVESSQKVKSTKSPTGLQQIPWFHDRLPRLLPSPGTHSTSLLPSKGQNIQSVHLFLNSWLMPHSKPKKPG